MRRLINFSTVVISIALIPFMAQAVERLTNAGVPVAFALWDVKPASFNYRDLTISNDRRTELAEQKTSYVEPLFRLKYEQLADGDIVETFTLVRQHLTKSSVADYGNMGFWVDASSQIARIEQAYTLLPGNRRVDVDPKVIQLVASQEDDIFTDSFNVVIPYSGLEVGAVSVLVVSTKHRGDALPLSWSQVIFPQWGRPRERFEFSLRTHPDAEKIRWQSDFEQLDCTTQPHFVRCQAKSIPPYPTDEDVIYDDYLPSIILSQSKSWKTLARRMRRIVESSFSPATSFDALLDDLLSGAANEKDRLDRIHQFVSQNIRYVGLEHGVGGIIPRPSALTLQRRFGDCKDKTTLFIDMARRAGLDAYAVLTSGDRNNVEKMLLAAPAYFNHMVACVRLSDGKEQCLDLTDPYSSYDSLSNFVQGAVRLDLREGVDAPHNLPAAPHLWSKSVVVENELMENGKLNENYTIAFEDQHAAHVRRILQPMDLKDQEKWALEDYHDYLSDKVDPTFSFDGINKVDAPLKITSKVQHDTGGSMNRIYNYGETERELRYTPPRIQSKNKSHPYHFFGVKYKSEYIYKLPAGRTVTRTGPKILFETKYGKLQRDYITAEGEVRVVTKMDLPRRKIELAKISEFNRFMDIIKSQARLWFVMENRGTNPDN